MPLSEDTLKQLKDVRAGKARKFVMIYKGAEVINLVLFKKGRAESYKKEARETGSGQFCHGVVQGKGANINFQLAKDDGYDKAPVRGAVLKKFLDENCDMGFKPLVEIVDLSAIVLDEEDPLVIRFMKLGELAQAAADKFPDHASEINTLCRQIGGYLDADQAKKAADQIDKLEGLLEDIGAMPGKPPKAPPQPPEGKAPKKEAASTPESERVAEAVKAMKADLEVALKMYPENGQKVKLALSEAAVYGRKGDGAAVDKLLEQAKKLLEAANPWLEKLEEAQAERKSQLAEAPKAVQKEIVDLVSKSAEGDTFQKFAKSAKDSKLPFAEKEQKLFEKLSGELNDFISDQVKAAKREVRQKAAIDKVLMKDVPSLEKKIGNEKMLEIQVDKEYERLKSEFMDAYEKEQNKADFRAREWMNEVWEKARDFRAYLVSKLTGGAPAETNDPTKRGGQTYELIGDHAGKDVYARLDKNCISGLSTAHYNVYLNAMRKGVIPGSSRGSDGVKYESYGWVVKITIKIAKANTMDNNLSPLAPAEDRDDANNAIYLNFTSSIDRHP